MSSLRVLLAEDDPLVRAVLGPLLEEFGCAVVVAEDGTEALQQLQTQSFGVIVSDMKMPGASGLEVLSFARKRDPGTRLVLVSGYADDEARERVEQLGGKLLHKPFGAEDLRRTVLGATD